MRQALLLALAVCAAPVLADQVTTAEAALVPQIFQDAEGYTGCGVRVVLFSAAGAIVKGGDFSLVVVARPTLSGAFKAAGLQCPMPCGDGDTVKYLHGTDYRLSSLKDGVPLELLNTMPADDPAFTMARTDSFAAMDLLLKIVTGERMQFAYTPDGSNSKETYSFVAKPMSDDEYTSFKTCLDGALKR